MASFIHLLNKDGAPVFVNVNTAAVQWLLPNNATFGMLKVVTYISEDSDKRYFEDLSTNATSWVIPPDGISPSAYKICEEVLNMSNSLVSSYIRQPFNAAASQRQQDIIDEWIDSLDDSEQQQPSQQTYNQTQMNQQNILPPPPPPPPPAVIQSFQSQPPQPPQPPPPIPTTTTSFTQKLFGSNNNSNTNYIPPPPPPPMQIQFAGNNKYVQMLNAETISVFVDINTGSPTWTLANDASIRNLKVVTYLLDDSGKVYFETIETMQTSWTLPTAGLSSQCISTCNEIRIANNSRCAELIRAPYNESISAQHQQKFDQWIDSLDEEAENLQSSKPVQPPQQPPLPPQPAVQPQQQQRLSTSTSGPTAPLAPIKDYKYAHVLNADGMPLFVSVNSGSASWSIPNDVKNLDDLKVVSYITEDTGRRYYELIEEEKTSWTWPTDGLSQNAIKMCQELEKMSNLQCANALALKFDAALSNRQQDKVNEWLDALDESADKLSALPVISGGSAVKRTSNSGSSYDHDSDDEDIRMSEFVRYQNIQDESLKKESTRRASLIDLRKQLNVVDAHNDDVQDSSHVKSIKSIRAERFKAGYMTKCAKGNERNWKKRYFVLNSYALVYYVNESYLAAGNSAGEFQLLGETRIQEEDENEHGFCFRVIHSVENMIIAAPTNDIKREWIKEISNVINKNQESLREYITVREKFMGITQRSKHFAILRKDVMTLHPNHEKICIIERVLNINQYTKITASDDMNCRVSLLDVSGKGISGHSKDFEVTFQFEDNQRAYIQWKGYLEQCIANYVQVAKSGSSAPVPRGNMSAQSSELSPAIPKPAGSLPRPPMPKPTLMGGATSTFSNKNTSNPSYRIDEATGLRTLVPLNEEKGRPVVRIIFDRYCSENELISIEGIHQIYYDFDKFYPIEEVAGAVNKSLGGSINSISYEDFMVFWRSVPKFDQLKTSKAEVQRRYEAAYRFRSYDINAEGYISRNDYAHFYNLLQTDGVLSSDSDAVSAEDSLKAVLDITSFNVVKFNNWITWFDAQKPPSKGQTILNTSTSTFGKLFGKLSGRTTSPGADKVSASGSDSRSSSPSRTQDTKPNNNVGVFGVNGDNVFDDDDEEEIIVVQHQPSAKPNTHVPFEAPMTTPSNTGNRTTTAGSSTPQQSSMVDNSFSAMQRRPVTAFSQSALTSNSISDFVQDVKYAREEDEKLFSYMTNKLNINQVVSGEDAPSRRRNTVRFKDANASSTVAAPTKSYSTCGVQTDEVLPINDIYRNPYEELLNERLAIQEAFEKLKNEESEILEFIRQKEDESLRKLQEMSDRLADEKRDFEVYKMTTTIDFEEKRSVLEGEKLKLHELKIKADKLHRARSTELLMSAAALSKHHKLLLQERRKTARQRFHLNFSLQQMHALQGDGNISPNPNSLNTNTNNRVNMRSESPVRQLPYQQGVNSPMTVQQRHQVATQQHLNRLQEYNNVSRAHTPKRQMNYTS
jgi:hypothetical protein